MEREQTDGVMQVNSTGMQLEFSNSVEFIKMAANPVYRVTVSYKSTVALFEFIISPTLFSISCLEKEDNKK